MVLAVAGASGLADGGGLAVAAFATAGGGDWGTGGPNPKAFNMLARPLSYISNPTRSSSGSSTPNFQASGSSPVSPISSLTAFT